MKSKTKSKIRKTAYWSLGVSILLAYTLSSKGELILEAVVGSRELASQYAYVSMLVCLCISLVLIYILTDVTGLFASKKRKASKR